MPGWRMADAVRGLRVCGVGAAAPGTIR